MQLSHMVYFTLHDNSPEKTEALVNACHKYLKNHPGVIYYAAGILNKELKREVNQTDYDVALNVVFADVASHDLYQVAPLHLEFIAEQKANWKKVRIFDADVTSG